MGTPNFQFVFLLLMTCLCAVLASYQGCYIDNPRSRFYSALTSGYDRALFKPSVCEFQCGSLNYDFAAILHKTYCFCGNTKPPDLDAGNCVPCDNEPGQECGNRNHWSVYDASSGVERVDLATDNPVIAAGSAIDLNVTALGAPGTATLQIKSGNSYLLSQKMALPSAVSVPYNYPGVFACLARITNQDETLPEKFAATAITVNAPAQGIELTCPEVMATLTPKFCTASAWYGTNLQMKWYIDSLLKETAVIPDPKVYRFGHSVAFVDPAFVYQHASATGTFVKTSNDIGVTGRLVGFEFYAVTAGDVVFMILAPNCAGYCYRTNACTACTQGPACTGSTLCSGKGSCENECPAPARYVNEQKMDYDVLHELPYNIPAQGHGYYSVSNFSLSIEPGYVIAFKQMGGILGTINETDASLDDTETITVPTAVGTSYPFAGTLSTSMTSLLAVDVTAGSHAAIELTFTSPGVTNVKAEAVSGAPLAATVNADKNIDVIEGVDFVEPSIQTCGFVGAAIDFTTLPHKGTNVTYTWDYGNGFVYNTTDKTHSYSYPASGVYNVTVTAFNSESSRTNMTEITIVIEITGLVISASPSRSDQYTPISFSMVNGSDFQCDWDHGDGTINTTDGNSLNMNGDTYFHQYPSEGNYTVCVNCSNMCSFETACTFALVEDPITGLHSITAGGNASTNVNFQFGITAGSSPTFLMWWDGTLVAVDPDPTNKIATTANTQLCAAGLHNITIQATNGISSDIMSIDFPCESPIVGSNVVCTPTKLPRDDSVQCTITVTAGTGITIYYDMDDGMGTATIPSLPAAAFTTQIIDYNYTVAGLHNANFTLVNSFSSVTHMQMFIVVAKIAGVSIISDCNGTHPGIFVPPGFCIFSIGFSDPNNIPGKGMAQSCWKFSDDPQEICSPFDWNAKIHNFRNTMDYTVDLVLKNNVSMGTASTTAKVIEPIENARFELRSGFEAIPLGQQTDIILVLWRAPTGADCTYQYTEGGVGPGPITPRIGSGEDGQDIVATKVFASCTVPGPDKLKVSAVVSTLRQTVTVDRTFDCQNPVLKEHFTVTCGPKTWLPADTFPLVNTCNFDHTTGTIPDAASITYTIDGVSTTVPLTDPYNIPVTLTQFGAKMVTIVIHNDASSESWEIDTGVYETLSCAAAVFKYREPTPPSSALQTAPFVSGKYKMPVGSTAHILLTGVTGTISYSSLAITDSGSSTLHTCNQTSDPFEYTLAAVDEINVDILVVSPIGSCSVTPAIIDSFPRVRELRFVEVYGEMMQTFKLELTHMDVGTILTIDFGDGTQQDIPFVTTTLRVNHTYAAPGQYNVRAVATNRVYSAEASHSTAVVADPCYKPFLNIKNSAPITSPTSYRKADDIEIFGEAEINCYTRENTKQWIVQLLDKDTWQVKKNVDMTAILSATTSHLYLSRNYLGHGLYRVQYTMKHQIHEFGAQFLGEAETYIQVEPSPLVCSVASALEWTVDVNSGLNNVVPNCYDPDSLPGSITLSMTCRQSHEQLPLGIAAKKPLTATEIAANPPDLGGCWRTGPGPVDLSAMPTPNVLTFEAANFQPNKSYELCTKIQKDDRVAESCLFIQTVSQPAQRVKIWIDEKSPFQRTTKSFIIGRSKLYLRAESENVLPAVTNWDWKVFQAEYRWQNGWKELMDAHTTFIGQHSSHLVLGISDLMSLDELDEGVSDFKVEATASYSDGSFGASSIYVKVSANKINGSCSINATTGTAEDWFHITCPNDAGLGDLYFDYIASKTDDFIELHLGHGKGLSSIDAHLPSGSPRDNHNLNVYVKICDDLKTCTVVSIAKCQVTPRPAQSQYATLVDSLNPDSIYTKLGSEGMPNEYISTLQSVLSGVSERHYSYDTEYCKYNDIAANLEPTSFVDDTRCSPYNQTLTDGEKAANYSTERGINAQTRHKAFEFIYTLPLNNPSDIQSVLNYLAVMVRAEEEITKASVKLVGNIAINAMNSMKMLAGKMDADDVSNILEAIMDLTAAVEVAADMNVKYPMDVDIAAGPTAKFDTNRETKQKDVQSDNAEEALKELRIYNNEDFTMEYTSEYAKILRELSTQCSITMSDYLAEGETRTSLTENAENFMIKARPAEILNLQIELNTTGTKVVIPSSMCDGVCNPDDVITVSVTTKSRVPQQYLKNGENLNAYSYAVVIEAFKNGQAMSVSNLAQPMYFEIPTDKYAPARPVEEVYPDFPRSQDEFFYHNIQAPMTGSSLRIRFRFPCPIQILVLIKIGQRPDLQSRNYDAWSMIPSRSNDACTETGDDPCSHFLSETQLKGTKEDIYIAVRELGPTEKDNYTDSSLPYSFPSNTGRFSCNYTLEILQFACLHLNEEDQSWSTDGCQATENSNVDKVCCNCTHLTTFGGGMVVVPNTIDWGFVFSNMDFMKNPTLYITEIVIVFFYIIFVIWARRQDKKDLQKLGLTPLADNDEKSTYCYEIVCVTGMRNGAATDSKVHFIVSGEEDETEVREFSDSKRKIFRRGAVDGFLMTTPRPLGSLNYIRLWHDNSGKGKMGSWYLSYIIIRDVHTDEKFFFISDKWFAVEEGDGQVDRVVPVAGKEQMTAFGHLFADKARKNLGDGHLWFSVITRPPRSRFTRVQRVSCCLCLLFMTMLANAMFYEQGTSDGSNSFTFGPFSMSPEQLFIGIASNLIVFPANFLLVLIFRKSRPKRKRPSRVVEALKNSGPKGTACLSDITTDIHNTDNVSKLDQPFEAPTPDSTLYRSDTPLYTISKGEKDVAGLNADGVKKKKKCDLPWWFIIVGWILLWALVIMSAALVTAYGIMFQDLKCKQWITSMIIAFITSIFITQPIKVFLAAIFFSLVIKNPGGDEEEEFEDEERPRLKADEELLHSRAEDYVKPRSAAYKPLDPIELEKARIKRLKEIKMWEIVREIVFYCFFLWILMVISYKSRSPISYEFKKSLEKVFILTNDTEHALTSVRNTDEFWIWAKSGLMTGIRAQKYYNGDEAFNLRGYINDKSSRIMGYAVMRQLRIKRGTCDVYEIMKTTKTVEECNEPYSILDEDQASYSKSWQPKQANDTATPEMHYTYRTADDLGGYPYWGLVEMYGGGGYVYEMRESDEVMKADMERMDAEGWIDKYTRAVFIEFTVYNPQINMFGIALLLAELLPSNGFVISYRFEPAMLLPYMSSVVIFQIICEIVYFAFTLIFIFRELREFYQKRKAYFKEFWNWVEMSIIALSVTAICIYFYKLFETNRLTNYFYETNGNEYMKFQYVGYWHEVFSYILGFLVFLATLKFLKLLRFNKRMTLLAATLKNGANSLLHFSIIFWIVFLAFVQFFFLTFVGFLRTFNTFISSMEACILMLMGKFDIYAMLMVEPFLTQLFVFLFLVTVSFILINMFVSLLNETFSSCRSDLNKLDNDYEIVEFMVNRFKMWTGLGTPVEESLTNAEKEAMEEANNRQLEGQIELFPKRIEKLLSSISNVYLKKDGFEEFMDSADRRGRHPAGRPQQPYGNTSSFHKRGGCPEDQAGLAKVHTNY